MLHFPEIIERIRILKGLKNEGEVASLLGFAQQTLSTQKSRGTIPFREILAFCDKENLAADWILLGIGSKYRPEGRIAEDTKTYQKDSRILGIQKKVAVIFTDGDRDNQAWVRGVIENAYDATIEKKHRQASAKDKGSEAKSNIA